MKKQYFTKEYLQFFKELAANNRKDWFDKNKPRYIQFVKNCFEELIGDLIQKLNREYKLGDLKPGDCIFRINKDVRFSKDKSPYKLNMSALINKGGRKNMTDPGLYIEIGPEFLILYTGFYAPEKEQLYQIRKKIAAKPARFNEIILHADFKKSFKEVQGEKSKIMAPEFKEAALKHNVIFNKQFYLMHRVKADIILKPDLIGYIESHYKSAAPFNRFLSE